MSRRAAILVLDGLGIGPAPDTDAYGDAGSNTLGNVARAVGGLALPNLEALGLGRPVLGEPASRRSVIDRLLEKLKYLPLDERLGRCEEISHASMVRIARIEERHERSRVGQNHRRTFFSSTRLISVFAFRALPAASPPFPRSMSR